MKIIKDEELFLRQHNLKKTALDIGNLIEKELEITFNKPIYEANELNCPHLGPKYIVRFFQNNESSDVIYADCPRVITSKYEHCGDSIELCLDCVLEQFREE